jgi:F-box/leucine-rich repeat protein 16
MIGQTGCPQLSISGLSCLAQISSLEEIELTNCAGATPELIQYLKQHLPESTVIIE